MYVCIGMCFCIGVCKFGNIQMLCELIAIDLAFIWPSVQVFAIAADARAPRHAGPPFALPLAPPAPPRSAPSAAARLLRLLFFQFT